MTTDMINHKNLIERVYDEVTPLKIRGILNNGDRKIFLLIPSKDRTYWQYVNVTSYHICPCKFETKQKALEDFEKNYKSKYVSVLKIPLI